MLKYFLVFLSLAALQASQADEIDPGWIRFEPVPSSDGRYNTTCDFKREYGPICTSPEPVSGAEYIIYDIVPPPEFPNLCCQGLAPTRGGKDILQRLGCGYKAMSNRRVHWGELTGTPGFRCDGLDNAAATVQWEYEKADIGKYNPDNRAARFFRIRFRIRIRIRIWFSFSWGKR